MSDIDIFTASLRGNLINVRRILDIPYLEHFVNLRNMNTGKTPLHYAVQTNNIEVAQLLLERGAHVNAIDNQGNTALHIAVNKDMNFETELCLTQIQLLIHNGAGINIQNNNGNTPLHIACKRANVYLIETLIQAGADMTIANNSGLTPLAVAEQYNRMLTGPSKYSDYYNAIIMMLNDPNSNWQELIAPAARAVRAARAAPVIQECQICLEEMAANEPVVMCPIGHWFHEQCMLATRVDICEDGEHQCRFCPSCRTELRADLPLIRGNGPVYERRGGRRRISQKNKRKQTKKYKKPKSKKRRNLSK